MADSTSGTSTSVPRDAPRRHLIVLIDGTGVTASRTDHGQNFSNIYRLNLAMGNFARGGLEPQITFYTAGIGSSTIRRRYRSQALGLGLLRDVEQAYMNICSNYKHHDEYGRRDAIYIFGFSRGAVVARLVADLIARNGLLHEQHAGEFHRVWQNYLAEAIDVTREDKTAFQNIKDGMTEVSRKLFWNVRLPRAKPKKSDLVGIGIHHDVQIEFLGVFDTVLGLYRGDYDVGVAAALQRAQHLAKNVNYAVQLLAIDETRKQFLPVLWKEIHVSHGNKPPESIVRQIWLPGVHTDVGGGYVETHLADVALLTMLNEIRGRNQLKLHQEYYEALKQRVARLYKRENDEIDRIHIHKEKNWLWRLASFGNSGMRNISNCDGVVQRVHDFALMLDKRKVVYKGKHADYKNRALHLVKYSGLDIPENTMSGVPSTFDD